MASLWRLHIRPKGGDDDARMSTSFCLQKGIIGMGWPVSDTGVERSTDFAWYKAAAEKEYEGTTSWSSVRAFAEAEIGDLVWFRDLDGHYYIAELTHAWEYCYQGDHIPADIVNFRHARIVKAGLADAVPGNVIACFRPPRTFQQISAPGMLAFAANVVGKPTDDTTKGDLFDYLTDEDFENIVFVYLQREGWYVLPGTRRADTPHYEYVLVHRNTGERAIVQVKSGHTGIDASLYEGEEKAFLFAASEQYGEHIPSNVILISRPELISFMRSDFKVQTDAVNRWISLVGLPGDTRSS
jgi:hypothetical protein